MALSQGKIIDFIFQVIDVIAASTNDMGPYSLDHFRKSNLSASWKIDGLETTVDGISEVGWASLAFDISMIWSILLV